MMDPDEQRSNLAELKQALRKEDNESFRWLLKCQGWSSLPPWSDYNLLVMAIKRDCYEFVEVLLKKGCRVMKPGCLDTPLHMIVRKFEWWGLVEGFLKLGARVSDADRHGNNVVHLIDGSPCTSEAYDLLLRQHQRETTVNVKNRDGLSFLHIACTLPNMELVKKCLDYNREDVNCQISASSPFNPGFTPLHSAVEFGNCEAANLLLTYGADPKIPNTDGSYPVHFALKLAMHNQKTAVLDLLVARNFIMKNVVDNDGRSLLMCACAASSDTYFGNQTIFIECNNEADKDGNTPLHYAARFGRQKMANKLLEAGAQCCAKNNKGQTPLAMAQEQGHEDVCNILELQCRCNQPLVG